MAILNLGVVTKLFLALRDGDLEAHTMLKPSMLRLDTWDDAVGQTIFFAVAPKDPTKIINLLTYEAHGKAQEESQT